jgi:hypothetical protein
MVISDKKVLVNVFIDLSNEPAAIALVLRVFKQETVAFRWLV